MPLGSKPTPFMLVTRIHLVLDLVGDPPEQPAADLAPGARQDHALDVRAVRPVVERRLVDLVQEAHRDQHEARARVHLVLDQEIERRELDRHAAALVVRGRELGGGVLELDLGVEQDPVGELVAGVEHGAREVGVVPVARLPLVVNHRGVAALGVAADREAPRDAVDLRRAGPEPVDALERLLLGHAHVLARAGELVGEQLDLALELGDAVVGGELLVFGGGRGERQPPRAAQRPGRAETERDGFMRRAPGSG